MKIAVIGSGISGLTAAYYLAPHASVTLFEKDNRLGGHTATVDVELDGRKYAIDTGFIVYNEKTYPNFIRLLQQLGVQVKKTVMGFSISSRVNGLEYSGSGIGTLFAQRRNIFSVSHWRMILDILRFNRNASKHLATGKVNEHITLGDYLHKHGYSAAFTNHYLVPMGSAIWSASTADMLAFPMQFFIRFFHNHGLLQIRNRPQWYVIEGGSRSYIPPMLSAMDVTLQMNAGITGVKQADGKIQITRDNGQVDLFDEVVFACHSDQALALLQDASADEVAVLGNMPYQMNKVVLHTDENLLPKLKSTWSSWNYLQHSYRQEQATLTYNMNILQGIKAPVTFCVTLNDTAAIQPQKILASFEYAHPVFNSESLQAGQRWHDVNGRLNRWYCGAYWRNGFHEDGVVSALQVVNALLKKMSKPAIEVLGHE
jgi:predicted NAD/FAD-binding protein